MAEKLKICPTRNSVLIDLTSDEVWILPLESIIVTNQSVRIVTHLEKKGTGGCISKRRVLSH